MFCNKNETDLNISQLMMYLRCPRKVYYINRGHETTSRLTTSYIEHLLVKELAVAYPDVVKRSSSKVENLSEELESELQRVAEEITDIYPKELADTESELMEEAIEQVGFNLKEIV